MADEAEMIPVWLLASDFPPRGTSSYTLRLARELPQHGFQPTIVCRSAQQVPSRLRKKLRFVEEPWLMHPVVGMWKIWRLIRRTPTEERPQLLHAQHHHMAWSALEMAHRLRVPYFLTVHDLLPINLPLQVLPERLAGVFAVSPSVERDLMVGAQFPADLVTVIPNGVDLPALPKLPEARPENRVPVVGTACPLEPVKGLTYFLMAAELILSSGSDCEFLVAGKGPEEETLRRIAQQLDIANRVTFVDYVTEYTEVLETLDVFVVSSLEQGLGSVMLEALALGKPVVATQVGGIADFFQSGTHALLIPPANHVVLAENIQKLLDDPMRARRLATAGMQFVRENFSVEQMVRKTVACYQQALDDLENPEPEPSDSKKKKKRKKQTKSKSVETSS